MRIRIYPSRDAERMRFSTDISLDPTLGCGQAHRWRRSDDGKWSGVIGDAEVVLEQTEDGFECRGDVSRRAVEEYFRMGDDLPAIMDSISRRDPNVASLADACPGLRILKQPEWECLATYILATNVNVKRIAKMVEQVCNIAGRDLGNRHAFPTPKEVLDARSRICECRLGFREARFIRLCEDAEAGTVDVGMMRGMDYTELTETLRGIYGVGPKVADCVALFGFGHLCAFPVDVRISKVMLARYGIGGSYDRISSYGRELFGEYAGYAQELLYHSGEIEG